MIKRIAFLLYVSIALQQVDGIAQIYKESNSEIIFAYSNVDSGGIKIPSKVRFTCFFHVGQNLHYDLSNTFGFFSGYGIRNIGIISDYNNTITKRRTYSAGIPLAVKLGSFRDHIYFYSGGEYEMFFHYKQKQYVDGVKRIDREWFSHRTKRFAPSFFAGIQFPGGVNLKFKYYPKNFLNTGYEGYDFGEKVTYSGFTKTQLFYFSLSFNFKNKDLNKHYNPDGESGRIAFLQK